MKITDEQKERAAHVNLPQFLMSHGFELKKAGREYVWKEHDSVSIKDNAPGERGEWYRFSTDRGGDNISFLREFMGMGFVEAVEALNGESYNISYSAPQRTSQHTAQARELSLVDADNAKRVFAYLCKTRGLDYELVKELVQSGAVSQEEKTGNVLFKYFDNDGKVIGAEKVGTSTEHKFKGIATGSASGYGFEVCRGNGSNLLFFESSIDMLSYLQMYQSELTDHRLVSMMGVKPQTVIDTMERYGITPDRVYLCSDNDRAGNEFAERLMTEYPDMKRIVTPDTYKDWNDMLRGIPKQKEQENDKKEVRQTNMQIYGNKIWNDATDNRDKSIITVQAGDFVKLQEQLERAGINYCAYDRGNSVVIAVNDKDVAAFANAAGVPDIVSQKSNRPYTPPEKNIIGNAEYRYIPQKEYISADRDLVLKMADIMARQNIRFSGRIYPTGKGTLTVSRPDLDHVKDIQNDLISRRSQAAIAEKGQIIGDRGAVTQNRHLYMSTLTPKQFEHINPFIDTNARYSAVVRDNKVMFSVDRSEAQAFHRALETAKREVGMLDSFAELGLPMEQMIALSPVIHRTAAEDVQLQLSDFFDKRYDAEQFGEMIALVNAYLDQTPTERLGENSRLSEMLEAKSSFDRTIELSDFFSQHDLSDEQRAAVTAMFVGDVTRAQIEVIDETFTAEDIQAYDEILHNALQESDVADFLTAHKQAVTDRENANRVPTEEEVLFPKADLARFLAEHTLSSDEWEDMAYPLFDSGYLDKHKPSDKAAFGYHLSEPAFYDLARRFHDGEDIRKELALGLLEGGTSSDIEFVFEDGKMSDRTYYYAENLRHSLHLERTEDGYNCSFGGMERFVSFEEIGQAFIDRIHEEYEDLAYWAVLDFIRDDIPDISDDTVKELISAFDGAALHGWENGDNIPKLNRIKKALFDVLGDEDQTEKAFACIAKHKYNVTFEAETPEKLPDSLTFHFGKDKGDEWVSESDIVHDFALTHPDCSFALGNAVLEYLDEKQHSERNIPELKAGWYKKTDFSITAVINGEEFNYDGRFDIGDGKGTGGGSLIDHIRTYNEGILGYTQHPFNQPEYKERAQRMLDIFVPFLETHSELTAEEQRIFDDFKEQHPIRTIDDVEKAQGRFQIYQLPSGDKYHGIRFEGMDELKAEGVQLNHEDYELVYEGIVGEFRGNATLEALYTQFNTAHPADFTGHSLSVSDVVLIDIDGEQTAYYCDTAGFVEMPEFFREKELVQEKPETAKVSDLAVGDIIMYDGARREIEEISPDRIKMKDLDAPDYGGILLGTSDVLAYDGWQQDMESKGFEILSKAEKPAPVVDVPESKMVHKVITNAGFDGGYDDKKAYATLDEAIKAGKDYMAEEYLGFAVIDTENDELEYTTGDFRVDLVFSPDFLRKNGFDILANQVQERLDDHKREQIENPMFLDDIIGNFYGAKVESSETVDGKWKITGGDKEGDATVYEFGRPFCTIHDTADKFVIDTFFAVDKENAQLVYEAMMAHHSGKAHKPVEVNVPEPKMKDYEIVTLRKVGDFYEMHGKNAEIGAEVLGLHMLSKNGSPMVGFPDHIKDEYADKLREAGYSVLIEQAFELNPPKREAEKLKTLQQVVDKFFGTDCESAETERGTWKLAIADGDKVGELFYGGEPVCGIYNRGDKMEIEPYRELTTFPALLQTAMLEHNPDKPVEIMDFQRTFETPLDKAKWLINEFCEGEYREGADFDDLHNVGLAFTTLTDDELPIQVTADLVDFKITYEFDGEVYNTEQYDSIENMIENGLTGLDFSDLVSVPDEVIERHTADRTTIYIEASEEDVSELREHFDMNGYDVVWSDDSKSFTADSEQVAYIETILEDRDIVYSLDGAAFDSPEQSVPLMSDASEVKDISSSDDVPSVTLKYKGDSESLDEIKDKALSLGATVIIDNAEDVISIDTYENHKVELDNLAYELGVMSVDDVPVKETEEIDDDAPLFADDDVIEQIKADEKADIPFWEKPDIEGEQLSLFGDPEPIQSKTPDKAKSEFSPGPVVDGVQVFEALAAEIDRGTGFVNGKIRVQEFYEKSKGQPNHPTIQELADFLKKEYGIGGHSGEGNISLVDYDSKGMTFSFENGEKFRHSWHDVAVMTESRLRDNTYLSPKQQEQWQAMKAERSAEENFEPYKVEIGDKFRNKATGVVSEVVSLTGALPYYTDDCTVKRLSGAFEITENISYDKLLNSGLYEYIGRDEPEKEQSAPVKPDKAEVTPEAEKPEILTVKNLNQLKKSLKPGMMFEITDHLRPECIGERRVVTGVSTVDFTSRKLDENGDPAGKDIYMEFDRAKNWNFDGGELTSRLDNGDMLMSFHFIDSLERTKALEREPISENVIEDNISEQEEAAPELSVGDIIEYKGKEYKVESLDMDGFITLNDTSFSGAVKDRVTFIADEFLKNAEYSIVTSETPAPDKGDNFTITDDSLGEGGAKSKFRANVDAIRVLKTLEAENRPATAEEKETLSRYVGWGAIPQAFDKSADKWSAEYKELSELLTPEEYRQARSTVGDAFYTSPTVIDSIYEALSNFGFEGGNVLEPAMGVGNFFGCMPKEMQDGSHLYGVEIDSISGRIAQALYPDADIAIQGFEKNSFQNGCFDVAVGNVPFGELGFKDEKHSTTKLHDYFFMEAMDKVKNGGIVAFVTSAGTLDKRDESVRQMLADKADLIGAIRLPGGKNGAFHDNAGTDVTTDIIFLQKHEDKTLAEMSDIPDWVHIGETADGLPINKYFEQHPDMVLGTVVEGNKLYGSGTMVVAEDGFDLKSALHEAVSKLSATISPDMGRDVYAKTEQGLAVKIPSDLRNFSFFMQDDQIFFKKNAVSFEQRLDKKNAQFGRYKAFIELRDITRELIHAQELNKPDSVIADLQAKLNVSYDDFYKKYGLIHSKTNKRYFNEDISYNLVAGLEKKIDKDKLVEKSDIFTKRTICPPKAVECVETAMEALTLSVAEKAKVDFDYMSKLTGMSEDELKQELVGEIFKIPHTENTYQTASEYLSGDIRAKLREAEAIAEYDSDFNINVNALQKAMPEPLKAGDIDVKIGATWLDPKYYNQFMYELLGTDDSNRADKFHARWFKPKLIEAEYSEHSNSWFISNKKADRSVLVNQKYGSPKMNAYEIFEHLLNLKEPKIYKTIEVPDGMGDTKEKRVVDIDATRVVQKKAKEMRKAFKAWIFKDPERREAIVQRYNELFNSVRPREYDGSSLSFPMMNSSIHLHDHQKNAIAHAMFGGNTLFAHSVGAGKTFEMIATAMESKRLGLCTKSLFAVPNHLTEQIGDDFQRLYPSANILVATKKDFQKANRQQLFAKIATGNYDAVIIGHSQLGMIPVSKERQTMTIQSQIDDILEGIEELKKHEGSKFQIKAMERTRKSLQKQLDKLQKMNQDETLTFEQLGIDKLFVDECHEFKNLFTPSKMTNIAGISNSASQKALDLFLKCRYLDEKTGGRGITYATGTPLSNSVTELHTMMRYLEYDFLKDHGLQHFDNWVSVFGEQRTDWELAPAGNRFKERTRIATFSGLPELMSMFKQVADIRTADTLDLDVPDCEYKVVQVEATPFQKELVQELADRADAINGGNVDPSIDNMLKITSDGRKLGLDPRLIDPAFEDNPDTKLNRCVENVARIHSETAEDKLTQIIFCDLGVPHKSSEEVNYDEDGEVIFDDSKSAAERDSLEEECDFCVYTDIKDKLVAMGIPAEEIAFIHDAKSEKQKSELFEKVRSGEVRILLGSTAKMGTGTNVQDKLIAVHDLDIPWRPADLEQRAGRIIRQGNQNKNVEIYRYVTKGTFDAYSYQTLENKQKFISQIMTSKTPARRCEDVDQQALTYSEIKALCTGDERIKEKLMLDNDVKELKTLASEYANTVYEMQDKIKAFPMKEEKLTTALANLQADRATLKALPIDPETKIPVFRMKIGENEYTDKKEAAKALEEAVLAIKIADTPVKVGEFQGFPLSVTVQSPAMGGGMTASMKGQHTHTAQLISSFAHNLNRIEAGLYNIDRRIDQVKTNLSKLRVDYEEAQKIVSSPFPQQEELDSKSERLETLTQELNQAAAEAKKNAPKRDQTCYFQRAQLKREAARIAKKKSAPKKTQTKDKKKPGLE